MLRVWKESNFGGEFFKVNTPFEAAKLIYRLSKNDLNNRRVSWNAFGLEEYEGSDEHPNWQENGEYKHDWPEWYSAFGESIDEFADSLNIQEAF